MSTSVVAPDATGAEVAIRGISSSGSGVGDLPDGRVVFVPLTAPGDVARVRLEKEHARWAVGTLDRLVEASADRVTPVCALFGRCGGCQLQHLAYDRQLEWKGRFIADALERIGHLGPVEPPRIHPSPNEYDYRNRATFTLRRLRGGRVVAGFHALGRPAHVVDVAGECRLPERRLVEAWVRLRARWGHGARLLPGAGRLRLTLRGAADGVELLIEGGAAGWVAADLLDAGADVSAVWHQPEGGAEARLVGGMSTAGGGTAFTQVNDPVAEVLRAHVMTACDAWPAGRAVDAYCGDGAYGRRLAERGWTATGIESDPAAVSAARDAAPPGFDVVAGRVEDVLGTLLPTDLLVVNPPRTGLEVEVVDAILAAPPSRLVYVSCDPATLARDLGRLADTHRLGDLAGFDLFPQTAHVETVAVLETRSDA